MNDEFYGSFTIEDAKLGNKFRAICHYSDNYPSLTKGKEYVIEVVPQILAVSQLVEFLGDDGKIRACHLTRFTKIEQIKD